MMFECSSVTRIGSLTFSSVTFSRSRSWRAWAATQIEQYADVCVVLYF
jgi:hypothetical protein